MITASVPLISGLAEIADDYDGVLVDLWGCLHNGIVAYPSAVEALVRFRERGGRIVLLSNAPRTDVPVKGQIARMGVPDNAWDAIMTAGLALRLEMEERSDPWFAALGCRYYHVGTENDAILLDGLDYERVADIGDAEFVLCCGIRESGETLDDIWPEIEPAFRAGLPLVSANPDKSVLRGEKREICAGAIAGDWQARGGAMRQEGKPCPAVYRRCRALMGDVPPERILAVGDGIETDIVGAQQAGIDSVWITGGLPAHTWGIASDTAPPHDRVAQACAEQNVRPRGVMPLLAW
ncbi:MAG: TIGR01459 family HAD-type hydrolase [Rhodospirillales bacterium]|nr:TIGR01459 family HAD-type hydrolase [Rhodospirillales bacterium]